MALVIASVEALPFCPPTVEVVPAVWTTPPLPLSPVTFPVESALPDGELFKLTVPVPLTLSKPREKVLLLVFDTDTRNTPEPETVVVPLTARP